MAVWLHLSTGREAQINWDNKTVEQIQNVVFATIHARLHSVYIIFGQCDKKRCRQDASNGLMEFGGETWLWFWWMVHSASHTHEIPFQHERTMFMFSCCGCWTIRSITSHQPSLLARIHELHINKRTVCRHCTQIQKRRERNVLSRSVPSVRMRFTKPYKFYPFVCFSRLIFGKWKEFISVLFNVRCYVCRKIQFRSQTNPNQTEFVLHKLENNWENCLTITLS